MLKAVNMMSLVDIVSSKRKAEILKLLYGLQAREFHLRELARRTGLALGTVQQELQRLVRIGLVVSRRDGNRVYFQANRQNPLYPDLRNIVLKTAGLANVLQAALQAPGIELAFVFGSIAAEKANAESDLDLMVIGSVGLRRLSQMLSAVPEKVGREVNPHILSREEFSRRKRFGDHFVTSVLASPRLFIIGSERELAELGQ